MQLLQEVDPGRATKDEAAKLIKKYKNRANMRDGADWRQMMYRQLGGKYYTGPPGWVSTNAAGARRIAGKAAEDADFEQAQRSAVAAVAAEAGGRSQTTLRPQFLSGVAGLYSVAFVSYYLQFPGLFGADGVQPVEPYLARVREQTGVPASETASWGGAAALMQHGIPSLLFFAEPLDISLDAWTEFLALMGIALSLLSLLGVHHAGIFGMLYLLYLSLYVAGQSMLSFQWDIFLLETGFATILYAPFCGNSTRSLPPVSWLLRFQLFKIMFMSGIVKTQANCPTWKGLTALEFHFASQCLPTAEAWWAHQLPPFLLRLGVAATFVTQIPGPFLLLAPSRWCRRLGVLVQAPLQLLIMITGNYNWFNLHVLLLCIPCWDADGYHGRVGSTGRGWPRWAAAVDTVWQSLWTLGGLLLLTRSIPLLFAIELDLTPDQLFIQLWNSMPHVTTSTTSSIPCM